MITFNFDSGASTSTFVGTFAGPLTFQFTTTNGAGTVGNMTFTVTAQVGLFRANYNPSTAATLSLSITRSTFASVILTWQDSDGNNVLHDAVLNALKLTSMSAEWLTTGGTFGRQPVLGTMPATAGVIGIKFISTGGFAEVNITSITGTSLTCFGAGTAIATPDGVCAVEDLRIGDVIRTADRDTRAVKWIGRQSVDTRFGLPDRLRPVRVQAGALGAGVPERDLVLTADHGLLLDGVLYNAGALVNGTDITFEGPERMGDSFTVYHIETEDHAVILAEGAPAETLIDYTGRQQFDNYAEYVSLYGDEVEMVEAPYPRVTKPALIDAA